MQKRAQRSKVVEANPEESEFKVGAVVIYYEEGWRAGHIETVEVDDDGDLFVHIRPIGSKYSKTKPRTIAFKSKELKLA